VHSPPASSFDQVAAARSFPRILPAPIHISSSTSSVSPRSLPSSATHIERSASSAHSNENDQQTSALIQRYQQALKSDEPSSPRTPESPSAPRHPNPGTDRSAAATPILSHRDATQDSRNADVVGRRELNSKGSCPDMGGGHGHTSSLDANSIASMPANYQYKAPVEASTVATNVRKPSIGEKARPSPLSLDEHAIDIKASSIHARTADAVQSIGSPRSLPNEISKQSLSHSSSQPHLIHRTNSKDSTASGYAASECGTPRMRPRHVPSFTPPPPPSQSPPVHLQKSLTSPNIRSGAVTIPKAVSKRPSLSSLGSTRSFSPTIRSPTMMQSLLEDEQDDGQSDIKRESSITSRSQSGSKRTSPLASVSRSTSNSSRLYQAYSPPTTPMTQARSITSVASASTGEISRKASETSLSQSITSQALPRKGSQATIQVPSSPLGPESDGVLHHAITRVLSDTKNYKILPPAEFNRLYDVSEAIFILSICIFILFLCRNIKCYKHV
jgi:hypothetical protein